MADIFISYSQTDADTARLIAALLSAQGYSVWYDTQLISGDKYREVIMRELDAARAVIVLWTANSVRSQFVEAEAARANADRKLIPLKDRFLPAEQIPLPFGNLHTTNFDNHEAVLSAVVAQLARPVAPPVVLKKLRYEVLTWFGIVGGALTIVNHWTNFITLADWMHWVVSHFAELTLKFWLELGALFHLEIPKGISGLLSMIAFYLSIALGSLRMAKERITLSKSTLLLLIISPLIYRQYFKFLAPLIHSFIVSYIGIREISIISLIFKIVLSYPFMIAIMLYAAKGKTIVNIYCVALMLFIFEVFSTEHFKTFYTYVYEDRGGHGAANELIVSYVRFCLLLLPIALVPTGALAKRLSYMLAGVVLIFGLSEVSKQVDKFRTAVTAVETH